MSPHLNSIGKLWQELKVNEIELEQFAFKRGTMCQNVQTVGNAINAFLLIIRSKHHSQQIELVYTVIISTHIVKKKIAKWVPKTKLGTTTRSKIDSDVLF